MVHVRSRYAVPPRRPGPHERRVPRPDGGAVWHGVRRQVAMVGQLARAQRGPRSPHWAGCSIHRARLGRRRLGSARHARERRAARHGIDADNERGKRGGLTETHAETPNVADVQCN